jgi:beta-glucosidase
MLKRILPAAVIAAGAAAQPYLDPALPVEARVRDLLSRMTLEEKAGQMNMPCVYLDELGRDAPSRIAACRRFAEGTFRKELGPGGASSLFPTTCCPKGPAARPSSSTSSSGSP